MANPQKNKGKNFERFVAKHLSSVFDLNFERIPNSGAFTGGKNVSRASKLTEEQLLLCDGDIIVPKELSHICFECKWYKEFSWQKLFKNKGESHLNKWIEQTEVTTKRAWFIIFRINRQGEFVCFSSDYNVSFPGSYFECKINDKFYSIASLDDFFESNIEYMLRISS